MLKQLLINEVSRKLKKEKIQNLITLSGILNIDVLKIKSNGTYKTKTKNELLMNIVSLIDTLPLEEIMVKLKASKMGVDIEVKHILDDDINIDDVISLGICLSLDVFFEKNPVIKPLFKNTCDLINVNNTIKSNNCIPNEIQGLYILTISKNNTDYIVKLGSFAETQGMYKRICSFGGGNYTTGSLTNQWFQKFIKKALKQGYKSKFTYYNHIQERIRINNLDGETIEIMPYVMRYLESDLFKKYNNTNYNIPPIFGSNCL
jgi:hypothetical protein